MTEQKNSVPLHLIREELCLAGISSEQEQRLHQLEARRRITPQTRLRPMEFLFRLGGSPCFARGELTGLSGKAKSGKTFVSSILMALCFRSQLLSVERIEQKRLHVLWYDTEQSEESTQDILRNRIIPLTGIAEEQFPNELMDVFNVRGEAMADRIGILELFVLRYQPDLVVLDGIRDLVADINDGVVAQDTIERLMRLASDNHCAIVCVLHQNKSQEDRNLRGWIGTELKNKAFEVYECSKSSERIFTWAQTDTRKYDIPTALQFAVNEEGLPYLCTHEELVEAQFRSQQKMAAKMQQGTNKLPDMNPKYVRKEGRKYVFDVKQLFADIMTPGQPYQQDTLKTQIYDATNAIKPKLHDEILQKAVDEKVLLCVTNPFGKKEYLLPLPEPVQQNLPF
ncbi:AAA family ATPase [Xylanibacter brevis]|uniref:AAA family ATPase n=1 Tax=Xylanibacter brevis TaxID=83231 RepID=UPI0006932652|nr:AAA family ATPase [Xylanibacter brevis]